MASISFRRVIIFEVTPIIFLNLICFCIEPTFNKIYFRTYLMLYMGKVATVIKNKYWHLRSRIPDML